MRMYDAACAPSGSGNDLFQLADLRWSGIYRCSSRLESLGKALLARIAPTLIRHDPARKNAARFTQGFEAVRNVNLSPKTASSSMMMSRRWMPCGTRSAALPASLHSQGHLAALRPRSALHQRCYGTHDAGNAAAGQWRTVAPRCTIVRVSTQQRDPRNRNTGSTRSPRAEQMACFLQPAGVEISL